MDTKNRKFRVLTDVSLQRFSHIRTDDKGKAYLVYRDGSERPYKYLTVERCLGFVEKGIWEEIK